MDTTADAIDRAGAAVVPGRTIYRPVQVSARGAGYLNGMDQVAFNDATGGVQRAKFYDGHSTYDLGTLGGANAEVRGLNNGEQIAGLSNIDESALNHGYRWSMPTGTVDLGTIRGGIESHGTDINVMDEVAGVVMFRPPRRPTAVLWDADAVPTDLGIEQSPSYPLLINDMGQVMGNTVGRNGQLTAFAWTSSTGVTVLGMPDTIESQARDINAPGRIAGFATRAVDGRFVAFLWTPGGELLRLTEQSAIALALSDNEMVVGLLMEQQMAFVWTRQGGLRNLGALPGGTFSQAYGVNNHGEVVGQAATADGMHAFLWTREEGMVDLNDRLRQAPAGLELAIARQINDNGTVLATTSAGALYLLLPVARGGGDD